MSGSRTQIVSVAITLMILLALAWAFGFVQFAQRVPQFIENSDTQTDAIVVLTGGSERVATGIALLADGLSQKLFISGVGTSVGVNDLVIEDLNDYEVLTQKITLGSDAEDTPGNARETARWVTQENVESLRLVTAAYHMPRSLHELTSTMPNTLIIPHPVFPEQVKTDWWRHPGTASLIAGEYTKYLFSQLRMWVSSALGQSREFE